MNKVGIILILILGIGANLYSQAITDSTIAMVAFWSLGDQVTYEFKETEDKFKEGVKTLKTTTYDVEITVVDSTENSYSIVWNYLSYKTDYELDPLEKSLMEVCADVNMKYITDEFGSFQTIENWKAIKEVANTSIDKIISENKDLPDSLKSTVKENLMSMFESEQQVNHWARELKFFHYLYGLNLDRTKPIEGVKYYTNPFLNKMMPGYQKLEVLSVDEENWVAEINVNSGIDGVETKKLMFDFAKQNMESLGIKDESDIDLDEFPEFSVTEKLDCVYEIFSGYIIEGSYSKLTQLNDDYKLTKYEYKVKQ